MMEESYLKGENFGKLMKFVGKLPIGDSWKQPIHFVGDTLRLYQTGEGPCGFFSVIQAYILLNHKKNNGMQREDLLIQSILDIMKKIRNIYAFCQCVDFGGSELMFYVTTNEDLARKYLKESGILYVDIASLILTVSFVYIAGPALLSSYAFGDSLIDDNGQTTIQFVLLMITGTIADSPNQNYSVHGQMLITGVLVEQDIGLILVDENESDHTVGYPLLSPKYKIWIVYYGGHFTTIMFEDGQFFEYNNLNHMNEEYKLCTEQHILFSTLLDLLE
ncbi:hypothetical protein TRFO_06364 [Tritrichomonas foetus]|uniref:Deubiquitinating enzyme MINDY-3/4 conserved domain-containing protein n=1 Tax=Tritrichomonas foetus TaxID=1144522 RepID=A0A1J4K0H9_9EUKA|nr:hypothetical protein TRFO_06364 [Tritrichomonas foetus]|eukprot:OHT04458.1 hypothetical protein TRFO_06364 [Tritrichomonas foetus]